MVLPQNFFFLSLCELCIYELFQIFNILNKDDNANNNEKQNKFKRLTFKMLNLFKDFDCKVDKLLLSYQFIRKNIS